MKGKRLKFSRKVNSIYYLPERIGAKYMPFVLAISFFLF